MIQVDNDLLTIFVDFISNEHFNHPVALRWILNPAWAHWTFQKHAGGKVQKWKITSLSSAVLMGICGKVLTQNTHIWGWKSKIFSYMALLLERSCIFNDAYYWVSKKSPLNKQKFNFCWLQLHLYWVLKPEAKGFSFLRKSPLVSMSHKCDVRFCWQIGIVYLIYRWVLFVE